MESVDTTSVVAEAFSEAIGTMAFLDVMPCEGPPEKPQLTIMTQIDFSGPINGTITVAAGVDFAEIFAENIGATEELTEEQRLDAMKELVNVSCGLALPMIASSPADIFDLTVPHLSDVTDMTLWDNLVACDDTVILDVEGMPVATRLTID